MERELKFEIEPGFELEALREQAGMHLGPFKTARFNTSFYDTADLRLARWGAELRHRSGRWTLKLPIAHNANGSVDRHEIERRGSASMPPKSLVRLATAFTRGERVRQIASMHTRRRSADILDGSHESIAEAAEDDVEGKQRGKPRRRFRQLEIELKDGASGDALRSIEQSIEKAGIKLASAAPKVEEIVCDGKRIEPELPCVDVGRKSRASELLRKAVRDATAELVANDQAIRLESSADAVHDARAAVRKARAYLGVYTPLLKSKWRKGVCKELRWLGDAFGAVRDADVMLTRARSGRAAAVSGDVIGVLERDAERLREQLRSTMTSARYAKALELLVDAARDPHVRKSKDGPARSVVPKLVRKLWYKVRDAERQATDDARDDCLHELRKTAKRCRYASQMAKDVVGKKASRFADELKELQDVLGAQHDAVAASARFLEAAKELGEPLAAEALSAQESKAELKARHAWPRVWKRVRQKKLRRWICKS